MSTVVVYELMTQVCEYQTLGTCEVMAFVMVQRDVVYTTGVGVTIGVRVRIFVLVVSLAMARIAPERMAAKMVDFMLKVLSLVMEFGRSEVVFVS